MTLADDRKREDAMRAWAGSYNDAAETAAYVDPDILALLRLLDSERKRAEELERDLKFSREDFATMAAKRLCVEKVEGQRDR